MEYLVDHKYNEIKQPYKKLVKYFHGQRAFRKRKQEEEQKKLAEKYGWEDSEPNKITLKSSVNKILLVNMLANSMSSKSKSHASKQSLNHSIDSVRSRKPM